MLTSVCWLFAVLCGTIAIVAFTQLQAAPSLHDTQKHCAGGHPAATQFDTQALSLVRHLVAFLSAIGNTTTEAFATTCDPQPDPHLVAAVTLYQRVTQRTRAQWVRDYSAIMAPPRTDIWSLPDVTLRPSNLAELWPCIAQVPISNASKMAPSRFRLSGLIRWARRRGPRHCSRPGQPDGHAEHDGAGQVAGRSVARVQHLCPKLSARHNAVQCQSGVGRSSAFHGTTST
ncbi:hypothetical protein BCR44DRAFT_1154144 [Catenaria anguillulae PL171]|uniref:Membrane-associated protein n=1 Tax=Catenaria anguillulae PL171 TaxID=765915 RepID=A0A1Y2HIQ4_9FUNG|nr:hypothetical protein BCR44DRAFT_1154144 [Catenaria anguillulae PL171]